MLSRRDMVDVGSGTGEISILGVYYEVFEGSERNETSKERE